MFYGKGLLIDKELNRYKKYVSVLFFKVGDWEKLPKISSIILSRVDGTQTLNSSNTIGNSSTFKVDLYCVYFSLDQDRRILVCKTKVKQEAIELASGAANYLNVSLKDYLKES